MVVFGFSKCSGALRLFFCHCSAMTALSRPPPAMPHTSGKPEAIATLVCLTLRAKCSFSSFGRFCSNPRRRSICLRGRDSCRLYGEHGIIVETSTNLEDILMSDYFQIEDRCVVQPGRDGGVHVGVEVQVSAVCRNFVHPRGGGGRGAGHSRFRVL